MDKDLVGGSVGTVGTYDLAIKDKQLQFKVGVAKDGFSADISAGIDLLALKSLVEKAIPGKIDDMILDAVFNPLLGL